MHPYSDLRIWTHEVERAFNNLFIIYLMRETLILSAKIHQVVHYRSKLRK